MKKIMLAVMFLSSMSFANSVTRMALMIQPDKTGLAVGTVVIQSTEAATDPTFTKTVNGPVTLSPADLATVQAAYAAVLANLKAAGGLSAVKK